MLLPPVYFSDALLTSPSAKLVTDAGIPYATQWCTPAPPRPSGSSIRIAKLFVPSGTPVQESCGDTFSPTQLGFCGLALATFRGIIWPSLNVVDVTANGSASAALAANANVSALHAGRCRTR